MKGPDERINAWHPAIYTIREAKRRQFMNRARDRVWQTESHERSATTSNQRPAH
jgi:hypothetical protein